MKNPGKTKLMICLVKKDDSVIFIESGLHKISLDSDIISRLEAILGPDSWRIKPVPNRQKVPARNWKAKKTEAQ